MTHLKSKALDLKSGVVKAKFNPTLQPFPNSFIRHSTFNFFVASQMIFSKQPKRFKDTLLRSIIANRHNVLRALMPPIVIMKYDLRPRPHKGQSIK